MAFANQDVRDLMAKVDSTVFDKLNAQARDLVRKTWGDNPPQLNYEIDGEILRISEVKPTARH